VFGRPQDIAAGNVLLTAWQGVTKGYTNHEHLNEQQLIHMNGRIYDFNVGRFLSVDPFLQFPENSQSANPYSYILNNPMAGTDPTGYRSVRSGNAESWRDTDPIEKEPYIAPKGASSEAKGSTATANGEKNDKNSNGSRTVEKPTDVGTQENTKPGTSGDKSGTSRDKLTYLQLEKNKSYNLIVLRGDFFFRGNG
jgi:RHS repeat-associated protein